MHWTGLLLGLTVLPGCILSGPCGGIYSITHETLAWTEEIGRPSPGLPADILQASRDDQLLHVLVRYEDGTRHSLSIWMAHLRPGRWTNDTLPVPELRPTSDDARPHPVAIFRPIRGDELLDRAPGPEAYALSGTKLYQRTPTSPWRPVALFPSERATTRKPDWPPRSTGWAVSAWLLRLGLLPPAVVGDVCLFSLEMVVGAVLLPFALLGAN